MKEKTTFNNALEILEVLSNQTRAKILLCLIKSPLCLDHLIQAFGLAGSTLSVHLRKLAEHGLIEQIKEGHWHFFKISKNNLDNMSKEILEWLVRYCDSDEDVKKSWQNCVVALGKSGAPRPDFLKEKVLFLCTGNSCRSQMAEALLRSKAPERFEVYSAGLEPKKIPRLSYKVMEEIGLDIRTHHPKHVMEYLGNINFDYLITVCPDAEKRCPLFPGVRNRMHWCIEDPAKTKGTYRTRLDAFRKTRDTLIDKIDEFLSFHSANNEKKNSEKIYGVRKSQK